MTLMMPAPLVGSAVPLVRDHFSYVGGSIFIFIFYFLSVAHSTLLPAFTFTRPHAACGSSASPSLRSLGPHATSLLA